MFKWIQSLAPAMRYFLAASSASAVIYSVKEAVQSYSPEASKEENQNYDGRYSPNTNSWQAEQSRVPLKNLHGNDILLAGDFSPNSEAQDFENRPQDENNGYYGAELGGNRRWNRGRNGSEPQQ